MSESVLFIFAPEAVFTVAHPNDTFDCSMLYLAMMAKSSILIASLAAAVLGGGVAYWALRENEVAAPLPALRANTPSKSANTIAHEWQWRNFNDAAASAADKPGSTDQVPSNVVAIYRILQSIKLDENGRVVPDQTMKDALEEGFNDLGPDLTAAQLSELQQSISTGLPGPAGEEAAKIFENYYRFQQAMTTFDLQPLHQSPAAMHERVVQLRRSYLGAETDEKLFAEEDANARSMFEAIEIQTNANLTEAEKKARLLALLDETNERLLAMGELTPEEVAAQKVERLRDQGASSADIYAVREALLSAEGARDLAAADREEAAWQSRFNGFWQARRYVMNAGLDEAERERQIEQLLEQYFSPEERERARLTGLDWQARDAK